MTKAKAVSSKLVVRDSKSGQFVTVHGAGSMKGQLALDKSVDLTRPIASQTMKNDRARAGHAKH